MFTMIRGVLNTITGSRTEEDLALVEDSLDPAENKQTTYIECDSEVFLSFCGMDTRKTFTDCLYENLVKAGICTYIDEEALHKGRNINDLLVGIERSRILIPILSPNYASRVWCLRELVKIMECYELHNRTVWPVFYNVEPSVVREQSGVYELAFSKHERNFCKETTTGWRHALTAVAALSGWEVTKTHDGYEGKLIDTIVSHVWKELGKAKLFVPKDIQIQSKYMENLMELLDVNANDVRIVGIHGKTDSGKTILAKYVYNEICDQFGRCCCFLSNIREKVQKRGLESLQIQLIDELLEGKGPKKIYSTDEGIHIISQRFRNMKVLILLDDVDEKEQLDAVAKERIWFGVGSRIIVTTRNKDILGSYGVSYLITNDSFTNSQLRPARLLRKCIVGSRIQDVTDEVLTSLMQDEIKAIGIYGLGGVGKTAVASNVHDHLCGEQKYFDEVYWISVSQNCTIYHLQEKIAKKSNIYLYEHDDQIVRAAELSKALEREGKVLLFLDDVWDVTLLEDVGIPIKTKMCKVILTSRFSDICKSMGCERCFKVDTLPPDAAWNLFMDVLGHANLPPEIIGIARDLTAECAGLPLAIITLGSSMRATRDIREWRGALRKLRESKEGIEGMDEKVFPVLRLSYDRLRIGELQQCFLYCAAYPEDFDIERRELIDLFIHTGLIKEDSREAAVDNGHCILNKLEYASLLERVYPDLFGGWRVKMHDLVRDMALRIKQSEFMVKAGLLLAKMPDEEQWETGCEGKNLKLVSLMENKIKEVLLSPKCPTLSVLLLHSNPLKRISICFFMHLPALKVLNLSHTYIKELPESVGELLELVELDLYKCVRLKVIPSLAKLTKLRKLNLGQTAIRTLPHGMEKLVKLEYLNLFIINTKNKTAKFRLHHCKVEIPPTIYACLHNLQYFCGCCFKEWSDFCMFFTSSPKLSDYYVWVGMEIIPDWIQKRDFKESRKIDLYGVDLSVKELSIISKEVQTLELLCISKIKSLLECNRSRSKTNFQCLKYLVIDNCNDMEELITAQLCRTDYIILPKLEDLNLKCLPSLKRISERTLVCNSLRKVYINMCPELKTASTLLAENLENLEELEVNKCYKLEELIELHSIDSGSIPNSESTMGWKHLCRRNCKQLEEATMVNDSQDEEEVNKTAYIILPKLEKLHLGYLPSLKRISQSILVCSSLKRLSITTCSELKRIPFTLLSGLGNLEQLSVCRCKQVVEIIAADNEELQGTKNSDKDTGSLKAISSLPKLKWLELGDLPNLNSIFPKSVVCNSLEVIIIFGCPNIKRIPLSLQGVSDEQFIPSSLRYIKLGSTLWKDADKVNEVFEKGKRFWRSLEWDDPDAEVSFRHLTRIDGEESVHRKLSAEIGAAM